MRMFRPGVLAVLIVTQAACVTLTREPRALVLGDQGTVSVRRLECSDAARGQTPGIAALDPTRMRIATWNIHKQDDPGWQEDLARLAAGADILLVQELVLRPDSRAIIEAAGLRWTMATSFLMRARDIGVLTASRVPPVATCTQRTVEPLLRLPKSTVISWYALRGSERTLAVANLHAINVSLSLGAYRAQLEAVATALGSHCGPIVLAGDLNTWTQARSEAVRDVARRLGLGEIPFAQDRRRRFLGRQLDHILVRGLAVTSSEATEVTSSDHNPVEATLRLAPVPPGSSRPGCS